MPFYFSQNATFEGGETRDFRILDFEKLKGEEGG